MSVALATATAAAESAAMALAEIRRSQVSGLASKPKELELTGRPEEDRRLWGDWRFAMIQYLASKDGKYPTEIEEALVARNPVDMDTLPDDVQARSKQLFTYLCGSVKGRLLSMLKDPTVCTKANGYEALRRFHLDIEPRSGAAALGLLETILAVPPPPKGTNLRDAIISVERLFIDYEATANEILSDHVKIAALRRLLPAEMRVHVNLLIKDTTTYEEVKSTVTEYEVAERRYMPLKEGALYDHTGAVPMDVDQVQAGKGKKGSKGKGDGKGKSQDKGDKPQCKTCGKAHKGECWYKGSKTDSSAKSKGKGSGDGKAAKVQCQICGKQNHTADKCFQRYKDKDKDGGKPKVNQVKTPETGATVATIRLHEVDTSPETELRMTTTGVRSCKEDGRALALIDTGSDEHLCPPDFAPWSKQVERKKGPQLRDAQGGIIGHESTYRVVQIEVLSDTGNMVQLEIPFLVAPVKQPIISLGKLHAHMGAYTAYKNGVCYLMVDEDACELDRQVFSYYLPCYPFAPKDEVWVRRIESTRMMVIAGDIVKYRKKMREDPTKIQPKRVEESKETRPPGKSPETKKRPLPQPVQPKPESKVPPEPNQAPKGPEPSATAEPKEKAPRREEIIPEGKSTADRQDDEPSDSSHETTDESMEEALRRSHARPRDARRDQRSPSQDADYGRSSEEEEPSPAGAEVRLEPRGEEPQRPASSPARRRRRPAEPAGEPPARKQRRQDWTDEQRRADNWYARQQKKARKAEAKGRKGSKGADSKGGRRGRGRGHGHVYAVTCDTPDEDEWVNATEQSQEDDHWTVSSNGMILTRVHVTPRKTRYVPTNEDLASITRKVGEVEDSRLTRILHKNGQIDEHQDDWRHPDPEADRGDWVGTTVFRLRRVRLRRRDDPGGSNSPNPPVVAPEAADLPKSLPLTESSRVVDMKARLKQLGAPVWGDKARLWARLQEVEQRKQALASYAPTAEEKESQEILSTSWGGVPTELKLPDPPGEVEKRLHELTHLPYAAWCEACVRGRGRSDPHRQLTEVEREKPCPQVCLDWFDVAGSNQDGERDDGVTQALLVIDAETGYTAASQHRQREQRIILIWPKPS